MQERVTPQPGEPAAGIIPPGNGRPVKGSFGAVLLEPTNPLWEKSPLRSAAVGSWEVRRAPGVVIRNFSMLKKKNSLSRFVFSFPGMNIGPPTVPPNVL